VQAPEIDPVELNVGACDPQSRVNGPGLRFVLWLQGCPLHCPGCLNPEFQPNAPAAKIPVDRLASKILNVPGIEGVTYTGGEPMAQARGLALLSEILVPKGLTVLCYTGYTLDAVRARSDIWIDRLLSMTDVLIDGPYVQEQAASLLWRGSRNQKVHFFTNAYRHLAPEVETAPAQVELRIAGETLTTAGIWPEGFLERLREVLQK
jgi:anaerobic ribonucleoside-triphosphate reductase activating protein